MEEIKNTYDAKKQEREAVKEKERAQAQRVKVRKSIVRFTFWILILVTVGYGIFLLAKTAGPDGEDFSTRYDIQGRDHIEGGAAHPEYNSNPPSSGWHYASPARGGFYDEPLPDEQVIHNLEHGDIWIAYHPDISEAAKDALKSFAGQYVVVSPRERNEGDISLVAWGRVDTFTIENGLVDEARIRDFIKRYDNRGPEKVRNVAPSHGF
ncbi:MAG: hypothetical protein COV08_03090 [Candidatus Vogelbacteria bacterium CG10_big_fil_rev_8_21_14_0_10_49_38]|uniref:DUF3105 domain-containing protein n=1 Tax=Candidatus Vogelbacteria bacterium CG10_big_fil_rev_8_21_14_0_10_49_38 TaxID=1975043 RepID=A0A2H0RH35_9BACT|nr:MAG: hypothetical protein BK006_03095 [bacterium CG10_49_38]PIR45808.1 MAG: hypothetical protein COV08_03090 [Candidatus Vogelbacteria bacterium CG10_big_fil_rev_8_21_14_0_10_49_38]